MNEGCPLYATIYPTIHLPNNVIIIPQYSLLAIDYTARNRGVIFDKNLSSAIYLFYF